MKVRIQRRWCGLAALLAVFASVVAHAQDAVLVPEVISREVSIHVGGVQTPEIKEIVSREVSLFILSGPADSYHEVISRDVSLANTSPNSPLQVTGVAVITSPAGDRVELAWKSYKRQPKHSWCQGNRFGAWDRFSSTNPARVQESSPTSD